MERCSDRRRPISSTRRRSRSRSCTLIPTRTRLKCARRISSNHTLIGLVLARWACDACPAAAEAEASRRCSIRRRRRLRCQRPLTFLTHTTPSHPVLASRSRRIIVADHRAAAVVAVATVTAAPCSPFSPAASLKPFCRPNGAPAANNAAADSRVCWLHRHSRSCLHRWLRLQMLPLRPSSLASHRLPRHRRQWQRPQRQPQRREGGPRSRLGVLIACTLTITSFQRTLPALLLPRGRGRRLKRGLPCCAVRPPLPALPLLDWDSAPRIERRLL